MLFSSDCFCGPKNIEVGSSVSFGPGDSFYALSAKVLIGDNIRFGSNTVVDAGIRPLELVDSKNKKMDSYDVVFEGDNLIGSNVTIRGGVRIGKSAIVESGSVVVEDVPGYAYVDGNPATVKKYRFGAGDLTR